MSNMSQLFDASRFPGDVKVRANGKATVMTLYGSENGSLRLFSLGEGNSFLQPDLYSGLALGTE